MTDNIKDTYYTIEEMKRTELKVKSSKFVATAIPASTKVLAKEALGTIRTEFFDASHNCFAYRIGHDGLEFRSSDDGEPNGSAGKPILYSIKKFNLSDLIIVVTRFFGGTRLGVGNLARAYGDVSDAVLELCPPKAIYITKSVKIFCTYEDVSTVKQIVIQHSISYVENYHDAVEITANIPVSKIDKFINLITEASSGRAGTVI